MHRTLATLAVVALVVVSGCAALGGDGGPSSTPTPTATPTADTTPTNDGATGTSTADGTALATVDPPGEHPFTSDGRLNPTALLFGYTTTFREDGSLSLTTNRTVRDAATGDLLVDRTEVRRLSFDPARAVVDVRRPLADAGDRRRTTFRGRERSCVRSWTNGSPGGVDCTPETTESTDVQALAVTDTPVSLLAAPAFAPAGAVERDGTVLYRYRASSFVADLPDGLRASFGSNATLDAATLLVDDEGRVVRYGLAYERDGDDGRVRVHRVYRAWGFGDTAAAPPSWVP